MIDIDDPKLKTALNNISVEVQTYLLQFMFQCHRVSEDTHLHNLAVSMLLKRIEDCNRDRFLRSVADLVEQFSKASKHIQDKKE